MTAFLLIILYVFNGHAVLEQKVYPTSETCQRAGEQRVDEIQLDENKALVTAGCAQVPAEQTRK